MCINYHKGNDMEQLLRSFEGNDVRFEYRDGDVWVNAADVCKAVGVKNYRDTIKNLDADEKGVGLTDTLGGPQKVTVVNESGLYTLIMRSRKPEAKRFRKWVTGEVLPSIRKTGAYSVAGFGMDMGILQKAVREAAEVEAARCRYELWKVAQSHGISSVEELKQLAAEAMENMGCTDPAPVNWRYAPPMRETVDRVTRQMVDAFSGQPPAEARVSG